MSIDLRMLNRDSSPKWRNDDDDDGKDDDDDGSEWSKKRTRGAHYRRTTTHARVCVCVCRWAKRQMDDGEERWIKTKYGQYEGPGHGGRHDTRGLHENKTNNYGCNLSELSPTTHLKTKKEPKLIKR